MEDFQLRVHESSAGAVAYRLHEPEEWREPRRLLVLLHGCTQDAADLAVGTGMNAVADEGGFAVLYPEQDPAHNPQRCWSWFMADQQRAEGPEVTRLVELTRSAAGKLEVAEGEVHLAGISAGGAMANVLAVTRPGLWAGLAVHSGIPWGAASDMGGALAAMQQGVDDPAGPDGDDALAAAASAVPERVLVLHGKADAVVSPANGRGVARQWAAVLEAGGAPLSAPRISTRDEGGRQTTEERWVDEEGVPRVVLLTVEGLGHAWSGGDAAGSYTDPSGPSASRLLARFLGLLP